MKKITLFILLSSMFIFASPLEYLLGYRNSKYALVGIENDKIGFALENSTFSQDLEFQYARAIAFYKFNLTQTISGKYALYSGLRYNKDFFDIGCFGEFNWNIFKKYLQVSGNIQPYYDSDLGHKFAYSTYLQTIPLSEVGLYAGVRNTPEYRDTDKRFFGGIVIKTSNIQIKPEVSIQKNFNAEFARVSVNFIYKNRIW